MTFREAYKAQFQAVRAKELTLTCGISQGDLAKEAARILGRSVSRALVNVTLNRGYDPPKIPGLKNVLGQIIQRNAMALEWLGERELSIADIWETAENSKTKIYPANQGERCRAAQLRGPAIVPGDPMDDITMKVEVEMIREEARKYFKLFRDPFPASGGIEREADILMTDEHRYIEAAMLDAAKHGGFIAVAGQVGSGKTTMRKKVVEQLRKDGGMQIIFPQILDKKRVNDSSLCDAIVMDISDQKPRGKHEQKARQVKQLLQERVRNGDRCCLIIEEAHNLTVPAFKLLKQLHELEDGFNKLLGIVLIGQTELADILDERQHPEMREVIRRIQVANIRGLNGNLREYLQLKFKRVGAKLEDFFEDAAIDALSKRLASRDEGGRTVSHAYPLTVNINTVKAINLAWELGESKVTEEVVNAI